MRHIKNSLAYTNLKLKSCRSSKRFGLGTGVIIDTVDVCFLHRERHSATHLDTYNIHSKYRSLCRTATNRATLSNWNARFHRFLASFDFPCLPFLICHLKQKLPKLSPRPRGRALKWAPDVVWLFGCFSRFIWLVAIRTALIKVKCCHCNIKQQPQLTPIYTSILAIECCAKLQNKYCLDAQRTNPAKMLLKQHCC